ncbi:MAG: phage tail sheath family protein [Candidatus Polarisedimenticolia bacterium]
MPTQLTYPGVYIEEVPSGVRTITGVATSITAFVGRADRGPTDDSILISSFADYERAFGGLSLLSSMSFAVRDFYLNGGRQAIIVRVHNSATAAQISAPAGYGTLGLVAANVGAWGNNLRAIVDHDTADSSKLHLFNLTVQEIDPDTQLVSQIETFLNVSIQSDDARYIVRVLEEESSLVRVGTGANNAFLVPGTRPDATANLSPPQTYVSASSGTDGADVTKAQFTGSQAAKTGLYALEKADLFNLLCISPYSLTTDVDATLLTEAAAYCRSRRAMLIIDPPSSWTTKDTARNNFTASTNAYPGITGPDRTHGAIFFPRLKQSNPLHDDQVEAFVPCGAVAGVFARTDASRGVWKAPAGQDAGLVGVLQLTVPLTDDENGELNPLGLNCLRAFPVVGRVVWGSRTLDGADRLASEWKYIPVRRTALFIEESLYRGTKWVVFEPNDEPLWALIRLNVGAFMQTLFRQGAFQGTSAREAYFVKCDKETTTQNDIDLGVVNILVGFAPLKPAEFVVIKIQQIAGEIQT